MAKNKSYIITKESLRGRVYLTRPAAIEAAKSLAKLDQTRVFIAELKEYYEYQPPRSEARIKRGYLK